MPAPLIERYRDRLPLEPGDPVVTLNEGSTPLVEAPVISERVGARVLLKLEGANPTGSFKDRGMTVAVSRAKGAGAEAVICASTGNTAASAAAYAARAGMRGAVIVPEGKIAIGKLAQALMHGARVIALRGNFDDALRDRPRARRHAPDRARQLGQPVPDRGPEDGGLRGLRRARRGARRARDPGRQRRQRHRLVAGLHGARTSRRCSTASRPRAPRRWSAGHPVAEPETVASAIRIGNPARWEEAMAAFTASRGRIAAVSDEQILDAYRLLASREGVFCEPASAASVAGLLAHGLPAPEGEPQPETVVCVLTGHGLKDPDTALGKAPGGDRLRARPGRGRARRVRLKRRGSGGASAAGDSARLRDPQRAIRARSAANLRRWSPVAVLVAMLAPPRCSACDDPCAAQSALCEACESALAAAGGGRAPVAGVGEVVWAAPYSGVARDSSPRSSSASPPARRRRRRRLAGALGGDLVRRPIVPVPAHPRAGGRAASTRPRRSPGRSRPHRDRAPTVPGARRRPAPGRPPPRGAPREPAARPRHGGATPPTAPRRRRAHHRRDAARLRRGAVGAGSGRSARRCSRQSAWRRRPVRVALRRRQYDERRSVRIEIRGRNIEVTEELREHVEKRFARIGRQVSELASLEVELAEERNPSIADRYVAEATLYLKGATLRASEASPEMLHSIHDLAEDIRRQVKRHREKRRRRADTRRFSGLRRHTA